MTAPGRLIAFEGGEGTGKSTQAARLAAALDAELTREPGGSALGERIRQLLLDPGSEAADGAGIDPRTAGIDPRTAGIDPRTAGIDPRTAGIDPRTEVMLALAARAQHVSERIRPVLGAGRDVVVDRFSGSTMAYQGYGRGLDVAEIRRACDFATGGLWPDLILLLDVPVPLAFVRRAGTGSKPDRFESAGGGFHERVAEGFLAMAAADPEGWVVIDGTPDVDTVSRLVLEAVEDRLGRKLPV